VGGGGLEDDFGAAQIGNDALNLMREHVFDANGSGEMDDAVGRAREFVDEQLIADRTMIQAEPLVVAQMRKAGEVTGRSVVDDDDLIAAIEQLRDEVATDKTRATRDQDPLSHDLG
jgi:hypothetical protein